MHGLLVSFSFFPLTRVPLLSLSLSLSHLGRYGELNPYDIVQHVAAGGLPELPSNPPFSPLVGELVAQMMSPEASQRPSAEDVVTSLSRDAVQLEIAEIFASSTMPSE
tara:strand:+ start:108 stop:431 length:324 start_codon:yes stop_codon:yes gene_type:complete